MLKDDENETYFATGRGSLVLNDVINDVLTTKSADSLLNVVGEWSVAYYNKRFKKFVCGRDIYARKSLCWRFVKDECRPYVEFSTLPGDLSNDWKEVFPGTLFIFSEDVVAQKSITILPNKHCADHFNIRFFLGNSVERSCYEAISFFPLSSVQECFGVFEMSKYTYLDASSLLKPTSTVVNLSDVKMESLLHNTCMEFYTQFEKAMKGFGIDRMEAGARAMILFSGGVDSLFVALTAAHLAPPESEVVLVNVAFGNTVQECCEAPDRTRAINGFKFLSKRDSTKAKLRLILVNVSKEELVDCRKKYIARAIKPSQTVLDDSIGGVLWFATRGSGVEYFTDGKIGEEVVNFGAKDIEFVLAGSGADEQLGGYARHRTVFEKFGFDRLVEELAMELSRIGSRNFGRDDRIASCNGRILLAPFLEEPFVRWLIKQPINLKVNFSLPRGVGEKLLLRRTLILKGLPVELASSPKQAMQFGSRISKLENKAEKGSDICNRLCSEGIKLVEAVE